MNILPVELQEYIYRIAREHTEARRKAQQWRDVHDQIRCYATSMNTDTLNSAISNHIISATRSPVLLYDIAFDLHICRTDFDAKFIIRKLVLHISSTPYFTVYPYMFYITMQNTCIGLHSESGWHGDVTLLRTMQAYDVFPLFSDWILFLLM